MIAVAVLAVAGIFRLSYAYFQSEELSKADERLSLYRSSVVSALERFSHLTYVLARDPFVIATAGGDNTDLLNARLKGFAEQAGLDAIYLMGRNGETVSASNAGQPSSFVGQNYGFRPYFKDAMVGKQGRFYGIGATTGEPGYFIADAVRDPVGAILGVIAIKIDLSRLQESWRRGGEQVFMVNADGVVLLSSDQDWSYRVLAPLSAEQREVIRTSRQFPGQDLAPLDWTQLPAQRARINNIERLHLTETGLPHGWQLHYLASDDRAITRAWLATGTAVILAGFVLILMQIQRTRRMKAALQRSEEEEAQLRSANERLAIEIEERRTAERRLKRTQGELDRASRLAALGRLAASVTHELGQPIAAMRNHLAAAELSASGNLALTGGLSGLVDRMEGITRQLKFFARTESENFEDVDLREAMKASIALVQPNLDEIDAKVAADFGDSPVVMRGSRLRLEQVMTNLLRNAVDAMEETESPEIGIRIGATDSTAWFELRDNGHGLGEATLADIREPFVTTRESGRGMGLGLAISSTIVNDHGGVMTAGNAEGGGAVFRVEFPVNPESDAQ
ncbi:sensor histidine kinase [Hoeflea poritis]|uniref:C4-dicarboxylate transport sensor protein n=1 Tax=Hoeflea poritis TaxID=2993659 RepID=A0ABT4VQ62_9HYPH|nr:ATP-binding protein [Hoeflea poritis]MDA4846843.1 cache domain-containing protein [Hoeflea poritis]